MKIKVRVKGKAPLVMHKYVIADDSTSKRGKKVYIPKEEAEKVAYRNDDGELCLPTTHFKAAMVKAGTDFIAKGKKTYKDFIKSGLFIEEEFAVLNKQEYEIYNCSVVVSRSRIIRSRPLIRDWECEFTIELIDEMYLNQSIVKEILEAAGRFKSVGDNRPEFGRFEVIEFNKIE